ncbi:MAG: DUF4340 domain-containing protein [Pseudomonadota bacterium]
MSATSPGLKRLATLAGAAGAAAVLAIALVALEDRGGEAGRLDDAMFPDFTDAALGAARKIAVASGDETFHAVFDEAAGWRIAEKGGYPAAPGAVRQTLLDLQRLTRLTTKTDNPDWHDALGLGAPQDGGNALSIAVLDAQDRTIADILIGERAGAQRFSADSLTPKTYVRRPGDDQTYLAEGRLSAPRALEDWLALDILNIERKDIAAVDVSPAAGPAYRLARTSAEEDVLTLADMPEGRELSYPSAGNRIAFAIANLDVTDVMLRDQLPSAGQSEITYTLFGGAKITVTPFKLEDDSYVVLSAEGPDAAAINAKAEGWAFGTPIFAYSAFETKLEDLLAPLAEDGAEDAN